MNEKEGWEMSTGHDKKYKRNSNLEILRILAMLVIVMSHFGYHGFSDVARNLTFNKIITDVFPLYGEFGVSLFVMISSWFMVDKHLSHKSLLKIIFETLFYSVVILVLFIFILEPVNSIGIKDILKSLFPVLFSSYWFVTCYILLMILSPLLNEFILKVNKKILKQSVMTFILLSVFISGTIPKSITDMSNNLIIFIGTYITIGYIKKYIDLNKIDKKYNMISFIILSFLLILSSVCINLLGYILGNNQAILSHATYFNKQNSILVFFSSLELFLYFLRKTPKENMFINKVASTTFGIYLIHDNSLMRSYIWKTIFNVEGMYNSPYLFIYGIGVILVIFIVCSIIDYLRQMLIEKPILPLIYKLYDFISKKMKKVLLNNKLKQKIDFIEK